MRVKLVVFVICFASAFACSSTKTTSKANYSRNHITAEEIKSNNLSNVYDLIKNLRPHWLRSRGTKSLRYDAQASFPMVYVNGSWHGELNSLHTIAADNITEIEFLNPGDATNRFGLDHSGGAILIKMFN